MIKIFRRIRHTLIQQGNVSKYLTYAIGEILLVVIGILIALSINNWNEENKDRKKETIYLNSLKEEFIDNRDFARLGIEFHNTQIKNAELILASIIGDTSIINLEVLHFALLQSGWAWSGHFNENIWTELKSTGNVGLITNNELRKAITEFHSSAQRMIVAENEWSRFNLKYRDLTGPILPSKLRISIGRNLGHYKIIGKIDEPLISFTQIRKRLNSIYGIEANLTDIIIVRETGLSFLLALEAQAIDILGMIENKK